MSGFLMFLAVALSLASFVFFISLVIKAFRAGTGWGLAVLFLPFAVVVFAIKYWDEARKPFLLHVGSTVASWVMFFLAGMMAFSAAASEFEAAMNDPEFQAEMARMQAEAEGNWDGNDDWKGDEPSSTDTPSPTVTPSNGFDATSTPSLDVPSSVPSLDLPTLDSGSTEGAPLPAVRPKAVNASRADRYVGSRVRIVGRNGMETVATLVGTKNNRLQLERDMSGGIATFSVRRSEIEALYVLPPR